MPDPPPPPWSRLSALEHGPATVQAPVRVRFVDPEDEPALLRLLDGLDGQARYRRWFSAGVRMERAADWAAHPADHDAIGLVALVGEAVVGHAVLIRDGDAGEVAFEVEREHRGQGIASALLRWLERVGRAQGYRTLTAAVLAENRPMLAVFREHGGFAERREDGVVRFALTLREAP